MQDLWTRIETWLQANAPEVLPDLNPGATEAQIEATEACLGQRLPEEMKALYRLCNGQVEVGCGVWEGCEFLSLARIQTEWSCWKELLDDGHFIDSDGQPLGCEPDPGVRNAWWLPEWIPLSYDGGGNHTCIDLNPAVGGQVGQIISMWHDDPERRVLAPSLRAWFEAYIEGLEAGDIVYSAENNALMPVEDL